MTDVNEAPFTSDGGGDTASIQLGEHSANVTDVTATDEDLGQTLSYTIVGGADADKFMIEFNLDTGAAVLSFANGAVPDFENPTDADGNNVFEVEVQVSDGAGGIDTQLIAVTITDVNEPPRIAGGDQVEISIAENTTAVTTVTATDPDAGQTLTYAILGTDAGLFTIDPDTGVLTFNTPPNFEAPADAGGDNVYDLIVQASDNQGESGMQELTVTVNNLNESPTVTDLSVTAATIAFMANDADPLTLTSPFAEVFGNPAVMTGVLTELTPVEQPSVVSGTLQVTDGVFTADVIDLVLGTSADETEDRSADKIPVAIYGFGGADTLIGGSGTDTIAGGSGADTIAGGAGADTLIGGLGADTFVIAAVSDLAAGEVINGTSESGTIDRLRLDAAGTYDLSSFTTITNIDEIAFNQNASGFNLTVANSQVSTADADTNGTQNDLLISAAVAMTNDVTIDASNLTGSNRIIVFGSNFGGVDTITGGGGNDNIVLAGAGADTLVGGAGHDTISSEMDDALVDGGLGVDMLNVFTAAVTIDLSASDQSIGDTTNVTGFEQVTATFASGAVSLTGDGGSNVLVGSFNFGDTIDGAGGQDSLFGGGGNDRITYDGSDGIIRGDVGTDTLVVNGAATINLSLPDQSTGDTANVTGFENVDASGSSAAVSLTGDSGANILTGGSGADTIVGGAGADTIAGGAGNEVIAYDGSDISIAGGLDTDTLIASSALTINLTLSDQTMGDTVNVTGFENVDASGSNAAVSLTGDGGANVLTGGSGADTIAGGAGADTLIGGLGADTFVIAAVSDLAAGEVINGTSESGTIDRLRLDAAGTYDLSSFTTITNIDEIAFNQNASGFNLTVANSQVSTADADTNGTQNDLLISAAVAMTNDVTIDASNLTGSNRIIVFGSNFGGVDTITGGGGNDNIVLAGAGADTLVGGAGHDTISSEMDDALVDGGLGVDMLNVFTAAVTIDLSASDQSIGDTTNVTGFEQVTATFASGAVSLTGDGGSNVLVGSFNFGDTIDGAGGQDSLFGGGGNDRITYDGSDGIIRGDVGTDTLVVNGAATINLSLPDQSTGDTANVTGFENVDASGSSAAVSLTGDSGANILTGGSGADTIVGGAGADTIAGGAGNEVIAYDGSDISIAGGLDTDTLIASSALTINLTLSDQTMGDTVNVTGFENVDASGSNAAVSLTGDGGANVLTGGSGADTIAGGAGADTLIGGLGADTFVIAAVSDLAAGEVINGTSESGTIDRLRLDAAGTYDLSSFTTITNIDEIAFNQNASGFNLTVANSQVSTADADTNGTQNDLLISAAVAMTNDVTIDASNLTGSNRIIVFGSNFGGVDTITGGGGNDNIVLAGAGADTLVGGAGHDTISSEMDDALVDGGLGVDMLNVFTAAVTIDLSASDQSIGDTTNVTGFEQVTATFASGAVSLTGDGGSNVLVGSFNFGDTIDGAGGQDSLFGGGGNDRITYDGSDGIIRGDVGTDTLVVNGAATINLSLPDQSTGDTANVTGFENVDASGSSAAVSLTGDSGANILTGGSGADTIVGGAGADTIAGGAGNDILTGDTGADSFQFDATLNDITNVDQITDFIIADDTILLDNMVFTALTATGTLAAENFAVGASATDADDFIIYDDTNGALFYDSDGSGLGDGQIQFATLNTGLAMTNDDFLVV